MGKILPVLMSGAVKCGRGFARLFMRRVCQILGKVLSALMSEVVKCQMWARFCMIAFEKSLTNTGQGFASANE